MKILITWLQDANLKLEFDRYDLTNTDKPIACHIGTVMAVWIYIKLIAEYQYDQFISIHFVPYIFLIHINPYHNRYRFCVWIRFI